MKILLVHSYLYEKGGDSIYMLNLANLLKSRGHEVAFFGMKNENNIKNIYADYELESIDYHKLNSDKNIINAVRVITRSVYSVESKRKISKLLDKFKPDIVHLHSIHYQITTSIISEIKKRNIPVVWTLHNFSLICCNYLINKSQICEKCKNHKYFSPILTKCKKDSLLASVVGSIQLYSDHLSGVYNSIDVFITPSEFHKNKIVEFGFPEYKIIVVKNFVDIRQNHISAKFNPSLILYFGNISTEKGIDILISAFSQLSITSKLIIAGDGPRLNEIKNRIFKEKLNNIELPGYLGKEDIEKLVTSSYFTILPSICYENFPNSILESFSLSRGVIGSNIGGIPELIEHGQRGFLFKPGDVDDLTKKIHELIKNKDLQDEFGKNGKLFVEQNLTSEIHYDNLLNIYRRLV